MGDHGRGVFEGQQNNMPVAESVVIRMGVQELRELITDVVQKAVGGFQGDRAVADPGLVAQEQVDEVVASGQLTQSTGNVNGAVVEDGGDEMLAATATSTDDVVDATPVAVLQPTIEG